MKRGFTLVELLVVITIIGVLSSVVLATVGTTRGKASDSKTLHTMTSIRNQAELERESGFSCANERISDMLASISAECLYSGSGWAIVAGLENADPGMDGICLDDTGTMKQVSRAQICAPSCSPEIPCVPF